MDAFTNSMFGFKNKMSGHSAMDDGFSPSDLHVVLSGLNPSRPDLVEGIYLGAKRISKPNIFSDIINNLKDANAAMIFYNYGNDSSNGHYTCIWEQFFTESETITMEKKYFYYDSVKRSKRKPFELYGPFNSKKMDNIKNDALFNTSSTVILFLFKLPLLSSDRDIEVKKGLSLLQSRANYIFKEYLHLHEFGVTLPVLLFPTIDLQVS
jgi:hypothetical protein